MKQSSKSKARKGTEDRDSPPSVKHMADELDTAYFITEATLTEQPESTNPSPAEELPALAVAPPLAPIAALWPDPASSPGASKSSQAPAPQVQTPAAKATAPQTPLAPAAELPNFPAQSQLPKSPVPEAVVTRAPIPSAPPRIRVTFVLLEPEATCVSLCGDFNGWSPGAAPMTRDKDGHWETNVSLEPGRYQYKFYVDGEWIPDPLARENVFNHHGSLNSVIEVRS